MPRHFTKNTIIQTRGAKLSHLVNLCRGSHITIWMQKSLHETSAAGQHLQLGPPHTRISVHKKSEGSRTLHLPSHTAASIRIWIGFTLDRIVQRNETARAPIVQRTLELANKKLEAEVADFASREHISVHAIIRKTDHIQRSERKIKRCISSKTHTESYTPIKPEKCGVYAISHTIHIYTENAKKNSPLMTPLERRNP